MYKFLIALATFFTGFGSFAQLQRKIAATGKANDSATGREKNIPINMEEKLNKFKLLKELNLTSDQRIKLKEIQQANKEEKDKVMNDQTLTAAQKFDKLQQIRKKVLQDLKEILTDEQQLKLTFMLQEKRKNNKKDRTDNEKNGP